MSKPHDDSCTIMCYNDCHQTNWMWCDICHEETIYDWGLGVSSDHWKELEHGEKSWKMFNYITSKPVCLICFRGLNGIKSKPKKVFG